MYIVSLSSYTLFTEYIQGSISRTEVYPSISIRWGLY